MKKVSLIVNHFERFVQLKRTLSSIKKSAYDNLYVVVLDHDSPNWNVHISELKKTYPDYEFMSIPKPDKNNWYSIIVTYNWCMKYVLDNVKPDVFMLQDAECYHVGDIISRASEVEEAEYISFSCFSTDEETYKRTDFEQVIEGIAMSCEKEVWANGVNAWYNHPIYRGVGYGFCCAMTADTMRKLNGFDERYKDGVAYGDDDFVRRVKALDLKITMPLTPFVVHQWHYDKTYIIKDELLRKNRDVYIEIGQEEKHYKAIHLITPNFYE